MRKLIVSNMMSLDGYFEGPGKNVLDLFQYRFEAYPADESFDAYNAERLRSADTLLLGRTMFEQMKGYWPPLAEEPNAPPVEREVSRLLNAVDKVVISGSLTPDETQPWQDTTHIIGRAEALTHIVQIKNQAGRDILVFGSRILWNDLLAAGLVDELHLMIGPVILGGGTPIFEGKPSASLCLVDARTWKDAGVVLVRYSVVNQPMP